MNRNARLILSLCLSLVAVFMLSIATLSVSHKKAPDDMQVRKHIDRQPDKTPAQAVGLEVYHVGESGGYLTVYQGNRNGRVLYKTDIAIDTLRYADQEMIRGGVWIEGAEELANFIESFGL